MTAVSMTRKLGLAVVLLGLAACGNDKDGLQTVGMVRGIGAQVASMAKPGGAGKAKVSPATQAQGLAQLAASALRSIKGPVILATMEKTASTSVLGMIGENNGVRTYATPTEQQMMLRGGLLAGTRGLGRDLMSSDTDQAAALIRGQRSGQVTRVQRYLDGDWVERPVKLTCEIAPAGTISAQGVSGIQMAETCTSGAAKVQNTYIVSGGQILGSRQWIGPYQGYVDIQVLRP